MTEFIIGKLIKNASDTQNPKVREAYGKLSGIVGIICNFVLFCTKLTVGLLSASVSITADAVNNLSDASSSIISLLGFKLSGKPADAEHPYGHGRYEYLSGLIVSVVILVIGVELLKSGIERIIHPNEVGFSAVTGFILVFSILLKLWMMLFNGKIGRKIESGAILAASQDSRNDVISTSAVLICSIISHFTSVELDGYVGILVAAFILYSGIELIKDTLNPLLGKAPDRVLVKQIRDKIMSYPEVCGTHDLLVHDYGPGRQFASVHVEMPAEGDVIAHHDIIDNIENDFLQEMGLHMVVHYDPIATTDTFTGEMHAWLSENIKKIDRRLTVHDLRIVPGTTHTNLIFDCVAPHTPELDDKMLKSEISKLVQSKYPDCITVVTIDRDYAALPH